MKRPRTSTKAICVYTSRGNLYDQYSNKLRKKTIYVQSKFESISFARMEERISNTIQVNLLTFFPKRLAHLQK